MTNNLIEKWAKNKNRHFMEQKKLKWLKDTHIDAPS